MPITSNPHNHTTYVDGKNTAPEMAKAAYDLGFTSFGFSEHAIQTIDTMYGLSEENEETYISEVRSLQKEYAGRMRIWLGMERDRMSTVDPKKYEYFLGANHYLVSDDGDWAGVDADENLLEAWVNRNAGGSWEKALQKYFREYADYIEEIHPDIIAHLDLIVKQNRKKHWFDEDSEIFLAPARAAMDRMIRVCDVMEVNTGGTARSNQPVPYPVPRLLKYWHDLGGRVIPASDCHRSYQLDAWFDRVPAYLKDAGYTKMLRLGTGDTLFEEVDIEG